MNPFVPWMLNVVIGIALAFAVSRVLARISLGFYEHLFSDSRDPDRTVRSVQNVFTAGTYLFTLAIVFFSYQFYKDGKDAVGTLITSLGWQFLVLSVTLGWGLAILIYFAGRKAK